MKHGLDPRPQRRPGFMSQIGFQRPPVKRKQLSMKESNRCSRICTPSMALVATAVISAAGEAAMGQFTGSAKS